MSSDSSPRQAKWPYFLAALIVLGFVVVVLCIIFIPKRRVYTTDAYVTAHYTVVAPRVAGQVTAIPVDDNQMVKAGQVLAELDPRDYEVALDHAKAQLVHDRALTQDAQASVDRQPALISAAQAEAEQITARLVFARQNQRRYADLARTGAGSTQENQQSDASLREMEASLRGARARATAATAQLAVLNAQHDAARATVRQDEAAVAQAQLNLSYTTVRALEDGTVGERSVQVGNYVAPGSALMALVPLQDLWISANYRELALRHVKPGQPAVIHVDAYDMDLDGVVDSISPASGAVFAPVAPENATGNFTKIVQRLPVKVTLRAGQPKARLLRLGMSVEVTIDTGFENVVSEQAQSDRPVTGR